MNCTTVSVDAIKAYGVVVQLHSLFSVFDKSAPERVLTLLKGGNVSGDISSFLGSLSLEDGNDRLSRNVGKQLPASQKNESFKYQITVHYILLIHQNN
jgi:hypothetical protein